MSLIKCLLLLLFTTKLLAGDYLSEFYPQGLSTLGLAILVNTEDPQSTKIALMYAKLRGIPEQNIIRIKLTANVNTISKEDFEKVKSEIDRLTPSGIQAYAITWTKPYKVDCMSMTSAITFGFDQAYCGGCNPNKPSSYFNADIHQPYTALKIRPSMMLAGNSYEQVQSLIERGLKADSSFPSGVSYLVKANGGAYDVRSVNYDNVRTIFDSVFTTKIQKLYPSPFIKKNILFYFTGTPTVTGWELMEFLPGAIADHLTSFGGDLYGSSTQTTALGWLSAGATASFGTVVEPCNHLQKFPNPGVAMYHYLLGDTLVEAYWKSVAWPGQGLFLGEPLAAPFKPTFSEIQPGKYELKIFALTNSALTVKHAKSMAGSYQIVTQFNLKPGLNRLYLNESQIGHESGFLRFERQDLSAN